MRSHVTIALAAALSISTSATLAAEDGGAPASAVPACVQVSTSARYVPYGYNHIVGIRNSCSKGVACSVSTDVNPQVQTVTVAAGTATELVTFMGSPSQTFVAKVSCQYR